jgi:hypothetical protein
MQQPTKPRSRAGWILAAIVVIVLIGVVATNKQPAQQAAAQPTATGVVALANPTATEKTKVSTMVQSQPTSAPAPPTSTSLPPTATAIPPRPTAAPVAPNVTIVQTDTYSSNSSFGNYLYVIGVLKNTGNLTATNLTAKVIVLDEEGNVSGSGEDYTIPKYNLTPGGTIGFSIQISNPPAKPSSISVAATGDPYDPTSFQILKPAGPLTLSAQSIKTDSFATIIQGLVTNGDPKAANISVLATCYDKNNKILDVSEGAANNADAVGPGKQAAYSIALLLRKGKPDHCDMLAYGYEKP